MLIFRIWSVSISASLDCIINAKQRVPLRQGLFYYVSLLHCSSRTEQTLMVSSLSSRKPVSFIYSFLHCTFLGHIRGYLCYTGVMNYILVGMLMRARIKGSWLADERGKECPSHLPSFIVVQNDPFFIFVSGCCGCMYTRGRNPEDCRCRDSNSVTS